MYNEDSFYAVNKLIEFAHAGTIQKQMTMAMNETIAAMRIPGVDNLMREQAQRPEEKAENEN
jgi:hypothetical protein